MNRRDFLGSASGLAALSLMPRPIHAAAGRPNILFIITDQQFADAMSFRIGTKYLHTPAMDRIALNGTFFTHAYAANPICVPSRCAMFTGRHASETGVQDNSTKTSLNKFPCMGKILRDAGYDTGYVGKWHMNYDTDDRDVHGFDYMGALKANGSDALRFEALDEFLAKERDKPFLLVASYINPHNICEWARSEELPDGPIGDPPAPEACPPAINNLAPPENETDIMALMRESYHNTPMFPVGDFDVDKWRQFRWAYYRLIEKVDAHIGELLGALDARGLYENTLIVYVSDHGDCHGAHGFNQKTVFYDESTRVPFMVSLPGVTRQGLSTRLVQTGIDILPTLCEYAGIPIPSDLPGRSVKALAEGKDAGEWRDYVVACNHMIQGGPVGDIVPAVQGRMVRSERYKYCIYSEGKHRESLGDMLKDPGEMHNLAGDPAYASVLARHRAMLREHSEKIGDQLALDMLDPAYAPPPFKKVRK